MRAPDEVEEMRRTGLWDGRHTAPCALSGCLWENSRELTNNLFWLFVRKWNITSWQEPPISGVELSLLTDLLVILISWICPHCNWSKNDNWSNLSIYWATCVRRHSSRSCQEDIRRTLVSSPNRAFPWRSPGDEDLACESTLKCHGSNSGKKDCDQGLGERAEESIALA